MYEQILQWHVEIGRKKAVFFVAAKKTTTTTNERYNKKHFIDCTCKRLLSKLTGISILRVTAIFVLDVLFFCFVCFVFDSTVYFIRYIWNETNQLKLYKIIVFFFFFVSTSLYCMYKCAQSYTNLFHRSFLNRKRWSVYKYIAQRQQKHTTFSKTINEK